MTQAVQKGWIGTNPTEGPAMNKLLIFAFPTVLINLVQQLYSMMDLITIGQFAGNIGAVGVNTGGEMAGLATPVAMGFSTAGQIFIAQLFGVKEDTEIKETVGTLLSPMLILSAVLSMVAVFYHTSVLKLLNCPAEAMGRAGSCTTITATDYPLIFGYNAVCGILRGIGESRRSLFFILVAAVVDIVLDLLLVVAFHMEVAGIVTATAVSQMGAFFAVFLFMWEKREKFDFELKLLYFKLNKDILKVLIRLGIPQVVRSISVRFGMLWVDSSANAYGLVVSATNSVGNKLQKFLEVFVQGIDTASASMVGQNLGARKADRAGKIILCTVMATLGCAAVSVVLCLFLPHQIFGIFTEDEAVIALGMVLLRIFILHFLASVIAGSFQAMAAGCGFVESGLILGLLDGLIRKISFSLLFTYVFHMGRLSLWRGAACSRVLSGCTYVGYYLSGRRKTRKLLTEC